MKTENSAPPGAKSRVIPIQAAPPDESATISPMDDEGFPKPDDACFYGVAGEIVKTIQPLTEAAPIALLMNVLTAFGSMAGRKCYFSAGGGRHHARLFWASVGRTSRGRKGTAWQTTKPIFELADATWYSERTLSGLSTGEGLIHQIRDNSDTGDESAYAQRDKRLLVLEEELARPFNAMRRDGNTLSPVLRLAWDGGTLRVTTKANPESAKDPHVSIIGHISREELKTALTDTDVFNGMANRFLWLAVRRGNCLPNTPEISPALIEPFAERMKEALEWADDAREIARDGAASLLWEQEYAVLSDFSEVRSGHIGAILARAEAQVVRLSLAFAMLDRSPAVCERHLRAALAVWKYAEDSARWIFPHNGTGNREADSILAHLKTTGRPVPRTEISRAVFNKNKPANRITAALELLNRLRLAASCSAPDSSKAEFWQAL